MLTRPRDTKSELRRAALRLFAQRGYSAVSVRDIAEAVGVRQGAIYNHFPGKQDLLVDLMVTHIERLLDALSEAMDGIDGAAERLEAFARFHVHYHIDYPDDVLIAYMELRSLGPEARQTLTGMRDRYEAILRDILAEGQAAGAFHLSDIAVHARAILAMMTGVTVWYREGGRLDRQAVVDSYAQAVLQSVGLPPRRPR